MEKNMRKNKGTKTAGVILLEVLVAVVILSVSLVVIIRALVHDLRAISYSADYTQSMFLAEGKMFDLLWKRYGEMISPQDSRFQQPFERYQYQIMRYPPSETESNISKVAAKIIWLSGQGSKNISLSTDLLYSPLDKKTGTPDD